MVSEVHEEVLRARLPLRERVGKRLQEARERAGLSQADVARRTGISLKYIGEIERGEANVSVDVLQRVEDALDVELIGETDAPLPPKFQAIADAAQQIFTLLLTDIPTETTAPSRRRRRGRPRRGRASSGAE